MRDIIKILRQQAIRSLRDIPLVDARLLIERRKALAKSGGYPDWKSISNGKRFGKCSGKKVLLATSIGSHLAAMQMETVLAASLELRGAEVHAFLCDGILPGCQICEPRLYPDVKRFAEYGPKKDLCGHCYEPAQKVYQDMGIEVHTYSKYLSDKELMTADAMAYSVPLHDIEGFEYEGLKIGEHAKAGALRFFARATIEQEPYGEQVLRRYLKAAIITAISTRNLLRKEEYDVAVFHHGIYVPQGIIGEAARKEGVRVVNWNPAYRKNSFIFSHEDTYHHTMMTEPVSVWEDMSWNYEREKNTRSYLRSRWEGENDWIRYHENPYFEKKHILEEIGCDKNKPIIGCLTNVMWDAQLHYPANAFSDMLEWLLYTIKYFEKRNEIQLVIRVHPAEISGSVPTRQPVVKEIKKYYNKLPENVFVIPPESNISTYVLADLCDSVIIYGTKTGVELTSVGIPVIVAGEAWIRNKGVTMDASTQKEYDDILNTLPLNKRLSEKVRIRAEKYAFHFFFRRMIPMSIFEQGPGWPPYKFNGKNFDDIIPGKDKGLDLVCRGILDGIPFIYEDI